MTDVGGVFVSQSEVGPVVVALMSIGGDSLGKSPTATSTLFVMSASGWTAFVNPDDPFVVLSSVVFGTIDWRA